MPPTPRSMTAGITILAAAVLTGATTFAGSPRVTDALQALYRFDEQGGETIHDRSEAGDPLDLLIETPQAVQWVDGHLVVHSSARISTAAPARRLIDAVRNSGALTVEAWIRPQDDRQGGPARIVSISRDPSNRNITLGQDGNFYDVRLRTTKASTNGLPSKSTEKGTVKSGELTHVVYTRSRAGAVRIYVNGEERVSAEVAGDFSNWDGDYSLLLANEASGDRPWLGELHLVALYSHDLSAEEVSLNFAAGVAATIDYAALLPPASGRKVDFVADVQPILRERCFECHAEGNDEGGLNLGVRARVMEGGVGGPVLIRRDSAHSRLIHLVAGLREDAVMPPDDDPLTAEQIGILRAWIDQGADWPAGADVLDPRMERAREHWAFQPLARPELPPVRNEDWGRTPIDRFILAALEANNLQPTERFAPRGLMRRVAFDVAGLPPTPEELDQFVDASEHDADAAWESLVDRLLAGRQYGERWGRHWLDVARYADSDGQEADRDRPNAWHYRDFVIQAFNDDMPFDRFVRWQLAGDEYDPDNPAAVAATGFLTAGTNTVLEDTFLEEERLRNRYNELDDILSTTGTAMLGLTIGCARCHDHKYDAISSREYYRLLSAFHSGDRAKVQLGKDGPEGLAFRDFGPTPRTTWLFQRADFYDRDQQVRLGFLQVLSRGRTADEYWDEARAEQPLPDSTYQRKALAEWMTDLDQGAGPLLARVIVNRVWQHHFGAGLVGTVDDFGVRSDPPTHPELLEWLASDFVEHGWKLKRLHRLILTSAVYQQGDEFDPDRSAIDPENRLLSRMRPQRLEAEVLRDAILAASGTLNLEPYGPGFKPFIPPEAVLARNLKDGGYPADAGDTPATHRRSVYMFHKRLVPYPLLQAFDRPDLLQSCGRRETTTVSPQALALLNDQFVRNRSLDFADRLLADAKNDNEQLVRRAFELALGRSPRESEQTASLAFITAQEHHRSERNGNADKTQIHRLAVADFCQTMFSLNEFLYVD